MNPDQPNKSTSNKDSVADIIRQRIDNIYGDQEPKTEVIASEASQVPSPSKHQKFAQSLASSGKDTATIHKEWHQYYMSLPEAEKKEVWDEFYSGSKTKPSLPERSSPKELGNLKQQVVRSRKYSFKRKAPSHHLPPKEKTKTKLTTKHYLKSLVFGLATGCLVMVIFLFSFFNELIIAPLIQPSRTAAATPVIIGQGNLTDTNTDLVIIPKINVEIPVNYSIATTNETTIENYLEDGVIHYPDTVDPGQIGNAAFFGHSSNNIFNPGKYKFAFVLLHTLVKGDTFYLTYNHTIYIYKVISTSIVSPNDVSVLGPVSGQTATATLITCDPPGTSINRLIVVGQQISPSVSGDTTPILTTNASRVTNYLPGNGPTLWSRFIGSDSGKITVVAVGAVLIIIIFRKTSKREEL